MNIFQRGLAQSAPADMLILAGVSILLLAIIWQVGARLVRKRSIAKRQRNLFYAMAEGVELKVTALRTTGEECCNSGKWCRDVQQWINHTGTMLGQYSAQAAISFRYSPDSAGTHPNRSSGSSDEYETLLLRLNSLRSIIEHPEAYL
jgi:hypothetical protein